MLYQSGTLSTSQTRSARYKARKNRPAAQPLPPAAADDENAKNQSKCAISRLLLFVGPCDSAVQSWHLRLFKIGTHCFQSSFRSKAHRSAFGRTARGGRSNGGQVSVFLFQQPCPKHAKMLPPCCLVSSAITIIVCGLVHTKGTLTPSLTASVSRSEVSRLVWY